MVSRNRTTPTAACPRWCPSVPPRWSMKRQTWKITACWTGFWSRSCSWNESSRRVRLLVTTWACTRSWLPWPEKTAAYPPSRCPGRKCGRPRRSRRHRHRHLRRRTDCHPDLSTLYTKKNCCKLLSPKPSLPPVMIMQTTTMCTTMTTTTFSRKGAAVHCIKYITT